MLDKSIHHNLIACIALLCSASAPVCAAAPADLTAQIINALSPQNKCVAVDLDFSVTMPQLSDDVIYNVAMTQTPPSGNPALLDCDYLIDWEITGRDKPITGFSAYFDGHHYRYSNERLQEYHMQWDSIPFQSLNGRGGGVQRQAQFANLLPASLAGELQRMRHDSRYRLTVHPDTLVSGTRRIAINAVMTIEGTTAMEGEYIFDRETLMPVRIILENNPGALSEQTVTVNYRSVSITPTPCTVLTEQFLATQYPDIFEKYRESNFRIENLPGTRLPAFALPTTTGERYARHTGDSFRAPTIVALIDASHGFAPRLVSDIRTAVDALPYSADVIWAFTGNNIDAIEAIVPAIRPGEHLLTSARSLARDCGVASLPVIILTRTDGTVSDVILGYNNELPQVVIQKMALIQP